MKIKIVFAMPLHFSAYLCAKCSFCEYIQLWSSESGRWWQRPPRHRRKRGIDSTDGTAPTNGTTGAAGGAAGSVGIAYYYSGQTTARPGNEETNTGAIQGTLIQIDQEKESAAISGSQGNDGWVCSCENIFNREF